MTRLPEWLDGPSLYDWIMGKAPYLKGDREVILGDRYSRTMIRWRSGEHAHYSTADHVLTKLGLHLSELPEDMWRWSKIDKRDRGIRHLRNGKSPKQVAAWFGVTQTTIRKWQDVAGEKDEAA